MSHRYCCVSGNWSCKHDKTVNFVKFYCDINYAVSEFIKIVENVSLGASYIYISNLS